VVGKVEKRMLWAVGERLHAKKQKVRPVDRPIAGGPLSGLPPGILLAPDRGLDDHQLLQAPPHHHLPPGPSRGPAQRLPQVPRVRQREQSRQARDARHVREVGSPVVRSARVRGVLPSICGEREGGTPTLAALDSTHTEPSASIQGHGSIRTFAMDNMPGRPYLGRPHPASPPPPCGRLGLSGFSFVLLPHSATSQSP